MKMNIRNILYLDCKPGGVESVSVLMKRQFVQSVRISMRTDLLSTFFGIACTFRRLAKQFGWGKVSENQPQLFRRIAKSQTA